MALGPEHTLADIVARAQSGDQAAFDAIYERFADPLFRYLYVRSGDASQAEELTGDVWVRVVEHLHTFRFHHGAPDVTFAAWVYQIARNLLHDTYRRSKGKTVPLTEMIQSAETAPDEQAINSEAERELWSAMTQLTPAQREVVLLRFMEERRIDEVAALTGRSEGAVKLLQHRAMHALAHKLGIQRGQKRAS